ncbi:MAG: helix-turn-helix domain-containing protein [Candidatus Obscuribacterales bacterium]|nr:helix-turn-helix domain-containing protein [Candidatus Obscuribacterales bacterium]
MKKSPTTPEKTLAALCTVLQEQRKSLGITQLELAQEAGMQRSYISDVEQGARNLSVKNLCRIAAALDLSLSELVSRAEGKLTAGARKRV